MFMSVYRPQRDGTHFVLLSLTHFVIRKTAFTLTLVVTTAFSALEEV